MNHIDVSVGFEHDNTYAELDKVLSQADFDGLYMEDVQEKYPYLFHDNSNTKCIHVSIKNNDAIRKILELSEINISVTDNSVLCLSILWNFPRKQFNEDLMWVCLSGFFFKMNNGVVVPGHNIVISNNRVNESASKKADSVIEYINECLQHSTK